MNRGAGGLFSFQRTPYCSAHENPEWQTCQALCSSINISQSFSSGIGLTLTAPMQFWQQAKSKPILSFWFIFQFLEAMSRSHPSGIRPSKKGNNRLSEYFVSDTGIVNVINCWRYLVAY